MYGQGKTRGQVSILKIEATTNQACAAITLKTNYSPEFLYYFLFREYERLRLLSNDGSQKNLSAGLIKQYNIPKTSQEEQEKIASFFGAIATRLTQLRRKHELLQTYKRGVMQKIFSQEIRFKRDDGKPFPDWDKKRLGEIANVIGGGTPDTYEDKYWGGQIQWFTPTELKTKYISNSVRTITDIGLQKSSAKLLPTGSLLFSSRATVGDVSITLNECATNQGFQSFIISSKSINEFLYYWIIQNKKTFLRRASGSTFLEISKQEISKVIIYLPRIEEQEKIAGFLMAINQKIDAIAQQIDLIERFKKGLLQKMFV
jgi:type I restriction enzyme, S subunit